MFNELIETEPKGADIKNRKAYFIVSSLVLGTTLFVSLIVSLFAVDLNLGMGDMDMLELVAPVEDVAEQKLPEPDELKKPKIESGGPAKMSSRQVVMARLDESPREIPTAVSTVQPTAKARPIGDFKLGKYDDGEVGGGSGRGDGTGSGEGTGLGEATVAAVVEAADEPPPPPPVKKETPVKEKPVVKSMGVVNGFATSLPKPSIPVAAKIAKAAGTVSIQVLIDENGNVVSATAVSGNELLRASSVIAARSARFTPTMLSGSPVKVSGIINYHFASLSAD